MKIHYGNWTVWNGGEQVSLPLSQFVQVQYNDETREETEKHPPEKVRDIYWTGGFTEVISYRTVDFIED